MNKTEWLEYIESRAVDVLGSLDLLIAETERAGLADAASYVRHLQSVRQSMAVETAGFLAVRREPAGAGG